MSQDDSAAMCPETYEEVRRLFHELCELSVEEQRRRLEGGAVAREVRAEVEALLDFRSRAGHFAEESLGSVGGDLLEDRLKTAHGAELPSRIGPFEVLRKLGEGGMGVVYAVRRSREEGELALKLIRPGLVSDSLMGRFRRESEVLRRLDHAGIATFLEAGEETVHFPSGQARLPYLLMERVEGLSLLRYARERGLDDHERLELLARVADALHHAHARGVLHRDLKPGNVLVTELEGQSPGQPKLLDFGVSLALGEDRSSLSRTLTGMLVGTLPYMSPEQVAGDGGSLDARSDVYGLGVIAFELLAGRLPYPVRELPMLEAVRVIREEPPLRLGAAAPRLRGELEVVVAHALEKHPDDRYASAAAFAADLRSIQAGTGIEARTPSWRVQLRRYTDRNRALVVGVAAVFLALLAGLVTTSWFALGQARAKELAERETAAAEAAATRARLVAASQDVERGDLASARRSLSSVPPERRGWEWSHLSSRLEPCLAVIPAPADARGPHMLSLSGEAPRLAHCWAEGTHDGPIRRLDVLDVESLDVVEERRWEDVASFSLSDDGRWLALMAGDARLRLQRLSDGEILDELSLREGQKLGVGFSAALGGALVVATDCSPTWVGPMRTAGPPHDLAAREERPDQVAVSSEGDTAVVRYEHHTDISWSGRRHRIWSGHAGQAAFLAAAVSPDGRRVAIANSMRGISIHELSDGPFPPPRYVLRPRAQLRFHSLAFDPSGELLAAASNDGMIRLYEVATSVSQGVLAGHQADIFNLRFSEDGSWLASQDCYGEVRLWKPTATPEWMRLVGTGQLSPDPRSGVLWVCAKRNRVQLVDGLTYRTLGAIRLGVGNAEAIAHHPKRPLAAVATMGRRDLPARVLIFDSGTGQQLRELALDAELAGRVSIQFSPDGQWLAAQDERRGIYLWSAESWELLAHEPAVSPGASRGALRFHPRQEVLVAKSGANEIVVLELPGLRGKRRLVASGGHVLTELRFRPDGGALACASQDGLVHLWDFESGAEVGALEGHTGTVRCLDWSPDGSRIATGSKDETVRLWDPDTREETLLLGGHAEPVAWVTFDPGGERLYASSTVLRISDTLPAAERHRQVAAQRALELELGPWLDGLLEERSVEEVRARVRAEFGDVGQRARVASLLLLERALRAAQQD